MLALRVADLFGGPFGARPGAGGVPETDWLAELHRALGRRTVAPAQLRVYRSGKQVIGPQDLGAVTPLGQTLRRVFDEIDAAHATLVLDGIDQISLCAMALTDEIGRLLGHPVSASLFYSSGPDQGFVPHRDPMPVVVWQVLGTKHWYTHEGSLPTSMHTSDHRLTADIGPRRNLVILTEGDLLHVPAGQPHSVEAVDGPSLHLSFAARHITVTDWIRWASTDQETNPFTSATLPTDDQLASRVLDSAFDALRDTAQSVSTFRRHRAADARVRQYARLPLEFATIADLCSGRIRCEFRVHHPVVDRLSPETHRVAWNGMSIVLHGSGDRLVEDFVAGVPVDAAHLFNALEPLGDRTGEETLRMLVMKGMVTPC